MLLQKAYLHYNFLERYNLMLGVLVFFLEESLCICNYHSIQDNCYL